MSELPMAQLSFDGRAVTIYFGPIEPGTRCGMCNVVSGGSADLERVAVKLDGLGFICEQCADNIVPGLSAVLLGLDGLFNGLIVVRGQNRALIYETLCGQVLGMVRSIASGIGAQPAFHEAPIRIGRLTDRDAGEHQFFWATYASEWDRFASAQRAAGAVDVEPFEFDDPRIADATAEWLADSAQKRGELAVSVMVGSVEDGQWVNWNLANVPCPPAPSLERP